MYKHIFLQYFQYISVYKLKKTLVIPVQQIPPLSFPGNMICLKSIRLGNSFSIKFAPEATENKENPVTVPSKSEIKYMLSVPCFRI